MEGNRNLEQRPLSHPLGLEKSCWGGERLGFRACGRCCLIQGRGARANLGTKETTLEEAIFIGDGGNHVHRSTGKPLSENQS